MKILGLHRGNVARSYSKRVDRLRGGRPRRLGLEPLEDRCLLSATVPLPGGPAAPLITPPASAAAQSADLSISVSDSGGGDSTAGTTGTAIPGDPLTYTITATNNGPSDVTGATISDTLPAALSGAQLVSVATSGGATSTATPGTTFLGSGTGNVLDVADLPSGTSIIYVLSGTIASSATGTMSSTVTVTAPAHPGFPGYSINAADTDNLTPQGDLSVSISDSAGGDSTTGATGTPSPGSSVVYTIVVNNSGPSDVTGATVGDCFSNVTTVDGSAGLQLSSVTTTATANASGAQPTSTIVGSPNNDTFEAGVDLPAGTSLTYTFTAVLASSLNPGPLTNTGAVGVPTTFEPDPTSILSASVTDLVRPAAVVQITMSDNVGGNSATGAMGNVLDLSNVTGAASPTITYTITVSNNKGPDTVTGAAVYDQFPAALSNEVLLSVTTTGGATSGDTTTPSPIGTTSVSVGSSTVIESVIDPGATLPANSSITYQVSATVGTPAAGTPTDTFTDIATFDGPSTGSTTFKPGAAGGSTFVGGVSATVTDALPADLVASLSGQTTAVSGHDVVYELQMTNYGPGTAQGIMVTYTVPAGVTLDSAFDPTTLAPLPLTLLSNNPDGGHTYGVQDSKNIADGAAKSQAVEGVLQAPSGGGTGGTLNISVSVATLTAEAPVTTTAADGTATTISPVLSASFSTQLNVPGASLVPSILTAGATDLVVTGGTGTGHNSDGIAVSDQAKPTDTKPPRRRSHAAVIVTDEGTNLGTFAPTGRIIVYGGPTTSASQSTFEWVSPRITLPVLMYGGDGPGASYLFGGGGNNVIVGGSGPNQGPTYIWGGPNYNLLIGGSGGGSINAPLQRKWLPANFRLVIDGLMAAAGGGAASNNLEVAGSTIYDNNQLALNAIMTEWTNTNDTILQRVAEITAGLPGLTVDGLPVALNSQTVQAAAATEYLFGSLSGDNLFFAGSNDYISGVITNPANGSQTNVILKGN